MEDRTTRRVAGEVARVHRACLQLALDLTAPHWNHVFAHVLPRVVPGWMNYEVDGAPARTDRDPSWPPPAHQMSTTDDGSFVPLVRLGATRPAVRSRAHRRARAHARSHPLARSLLPFAAQLDGTALTMVFRSRSAVARRDRFHVRLELLTGAAGIIYQVRGPSKRALKSFPAHYWQTQAQHGAFGRESAGSGVLTAGGWSTIFSRFSILCAQLAALDSAWACERSGGGAAAAADVRLRKTRRNRVVAPSHTGGAEIPQLLDGQRLAEVDRGRAVQLAQMVAGESAAALATGRWGDPRELEQRVAQYNAMLSGCLATVRADKRMRLYDDESESDEEGGYAYS